MPVNQAINAADAVVLPMPMSPVTRRSAPASTSVVATSRPDVERCASLGQGHRRPVDRSAVPARTLRSSSAGCGVERRGDPDVDDDEAGAVLTGEDADRRPAGAEVGDHLGRDLLRPRRHTGRARRRGRRRTPRPPAGRHRRRHRAAMPAQDHSELLDEAERAAGLGQPGLPGAGPLHRLAVERTQVADRCVEGRHPGLTDPLIAHCGRSRRRGRRRRARRPRPTTRARRAAPRAGRCGRPGARRSRCSGSVLSRTTFSSSR